MNPRLTLKELFIGEACLIVFAAVLAWLFEPLQDFFSHLSLMTICWLLLQLPVAWLKDLDYIPHDENSDSPVKLYLYFTIFSGAYLGGKLYTILFPQGSFLVDL